MKVMLSAAEIRTGVNKLADTISEHYKDQPLTIVGVMTGSLVFMADLIRQLEMPLRVGILQASSYREGTERGPLIVNSEMLLDIAARDVLVIDDIFDTGHTLVNVLDSMRELHPKSIRSAVLLKKLGRQQVDIEPDYAAFEIPNEFVVGYGLDYLDQYRNLPYLAVLDPDDI